MVFQKNKLGLVRVTKSLFRLYILRQMVPLFVIWYLTNKCNAKCKYCDIPLREKKELPTNRVLKLIDEMAKRGVLRIGFVGGEPLLRKDIDTIISHAKNKGLMVHLYSNGFLAKEHLKTIKKLDGVFFSLDGPEKIHDSMRGKGSHKKVMNAIKLCNKYTPTFVTSVLTKKNINYISYMSELSKKENFLLNFQPVLQIPSLSSDISSYKLSETELKKCLTNILQLKKSNSNIALSEVYLKRMLKRNSSTQKKGYQLGIVKCWNGQAACHIDSNGDLFSCIHLNNKEKALNLKDNSFGKAFENVHSCSCKTCNVTCSVEYNFWLSLHPGAILNLTNMLKRIRRNSK